MVSLVTLPSLSTNVRHVRSISLPSRSHPTILQVEEQLAHLKSCETSFSSSSSSNSSMANVESVCGSLMRLQKLYTSVNDVIGLSQIQQALLHIKDEKLVDELLDRSMSLLDVCGSIKDAMEQIKDHIRNTQSALRRRKQDHKTDHASSLIWKMKDAKRAILALKQIDSKIAGFTLLDLDHHLLSLVRSLRDTCALSVSIFGSLMSSNSVFVSKPKSTKWTIVSGLIRKRKTASVDQPQPQPQPHDVSNEGLESHIEMIEESLESMSRTLIKARVSLLNIRSH